MPSHPLILFIERQIMGKLNFYTADLEYVEYLQNAEQKNRGFSRVPNMTYNDKYKQKFLCGIVLQVNGMDYYVPVTSFKQQKPDNFLITADNGQVVSSLRFNYMFPVPKGLLAVHVIANETDRAYRALLAQELKYCIKNQAIIQRLAERTYKRVLLGKDLGLVINSCDFRLLEQKCCEYMPMDVHYKKNILTAADYLMFIDTLDEYNATIEQAELSVANQVFSVSAIKSDKHIGMARLLGDKATYWIITDVLVLPEYQGKGIGRKLMESLLKYIRDNAPKGEHLLFLLSNKGKEGFYRKMGFEEVPNDDEGSGMAMEIKVK